MHRITCSLPVDREPWNRPLIERVRLFQQSKILGKRIALFLYHHADTSTFRYRGYNVMQATLRSERWQCVYFFMDELEWLEQFLPEAALLIFGRLHWVHALEKLSQEAKKASIPVLYDVDDLVFDLDLLPLVTNTLNVSYAAEEDYSFWFAYISRLGFTAAMADGFLTTNDFLGGHLTEKFGKPYQIICNSLNLEQLEISDQCLKRKKKTRSVKPFTIGYFSGTPSHINDFRIVYPELIQLLSDFPDMCLKVVGFMEFPQEMQQLICDKRVKFTPLVDFMELQRLMAQVDVNIVPLVNNIFTNCKSELKYFEAAIVGTPTVATPTFTYANAISDGETGYLCQPGQWYEAIKHLYENPQDGRRMASAARTECLETYCGAQFVEEIECAYDFFAN